MAKKSSKEEKGLLTTEQEAQFGVILDELVDFTKFKGFVWKLIEPFDHKLFASGIGLLDDTLGDKVPASLKPSAQQFVMAVINKDQEGIVTYGTLLLNMLIDIPKLTEEAEAIIIANMLTALVQIIFIKLT